MQLVKIRENAELVMTEDEGIIYIGMLCFAVPVHELAFAVEGVSAAVNGATKGIEPFDMATEGIQYGVLQLFENDEVDTRAFKIDGTKIETAVQFVEFLANQGVMEDTKFSVVVEHLQRIFELNAHQENFTRRSEDARVIYRALCSQLEQVVEPARDEANPQNILSEKLVQLLQRLESGQLPLGPIEELLSICEASETEKYLPEVMTVGSVIGLLAFLILSKGESLCTKFMRELCESLSLSYDGAERYACQIWSAPRLSSESDGGESDEPVVEQIQSKWSLRRDLFCLTRDD